MPNSDQQVVWDCLGARIRIYPINHERGFDVLCFFDCNYYQYYKWNTLKIVNYHDVNFVVTSATAGVVTVATTGAKNYDKVVIATIQCIKSRL